MEILQSVKKNTLIDQLDPRVKLAWLFILSLVALKQTTLLPIGLLLLSLIPVWLLARRFQLVISITIKTIPFLMFLTVIQLLNLGITTGKWFGIDEFYKVALIIIRFFIMINSAILLFQTTSSAQIMMAIRSAKWSSNPNPWNKFIEALAFALGTGYQFVPLLEREMMTVVQVQRARGSGVTEGSKVEQVKKLVAMGTPLFTRALEIIKNAGLMITNYNYSPLRFRSQLRCLQFRRLDWLALVVVLGWAGCFIVFL